jgi:lipopolysaccharide transport system permease protein
MLSAFIGRELRARYVGSVLGRAWPFLHPLLILAVYWLVFVRILQVRLGNPDWAKPISEAFGENAADTFHVVLLCGGLVPWLVTAEFLMRCTTTIVENGGLVKKISFPTELLPVYLLGAYFINLLIMVAIFIAGTYIFTPFRSPLLWMLPIVMIVHGILLLGLGYLLATLNVFIRDVQQLMPLVVNIWFFLTPVVYPREMLPEGAKEWAWVFDWNPMSHLIQVYRWTTVFPEKIRMTVDASGAVVPVTTAHIWYELGIVAGVAVMFFAIGYGVFMSQKHKFADEI